MAPEWVLFAIVCIFWGAYLLRPIIARTTGTTAGSDEHRRLAEAKRGYLFALRDAEIDFESGKLAEADYRAIRARLEEKAAEAIRLLDELGGGTPEEKVQRALDELRRRPGATAVLLLLLSVGVAHAASIQGRLLDGSTPDGFVTDHDVRLTAQLGAGERVDRNVATDEKGFYAFTELPGDTADVYVLSTSFDGVDYVSNFIRFPLGADLVESDLLVYHSTTEDSLLRLNARHLVIEIAPDADHVLVTEVLAFGNPGQRTIVPEHPIALHIPHAAFNVVAVEGFEDAQVADDHVNLTLTGGVRPGTFRYEGAVRYHLPARFPLGVTVQETVPTDEVTVLVAPAGTDVSGEGLEPLGVIDLGGGVVCDRYRLPVEAGAPAMTVFIDPTVRAMSRDPRTWTIVLGLGAFFAALVLLRERGGSGPARPTEDLARLERDRQRYLVEIVALEAGADGDPAAHREREKLLVKATAIQELMDEMAERGA